VREHDAGENKGVKRCSVEKIVPARFFPENAIFPADGHGHCYMSRVVNGASDVQEMQIANLMLIIARVVYQLALEHCVHSREREQFDKFLAEKVISANYRPLVHF